MWIGMAVCELSEGWIARPKMKFEDLTPAPRSHSKHATLAVKPWM